jgi:hypothetical protein
MPNVKFFFVGLRESMPAKTVSEKAPALMLVPNPNIPEVPEPNASLEVLATITGQLGVQRKSRT